MHPRLSSLCTQTPDDLTQYGFNHPKLTDNCLIYLSRLDLSLGSNCLMLSLLGILMCSSHVICPKWNWFLSIPTPAGILPCCHKWYPLSPNYSKQKYRVTPFFSLPHHIHQQHMLFHLSDSSQNFMSFGCKGLHTNSNHYSSRLDYCSIQLTGFFCTPFLFSLNPLPHILVWMILQM